MKRLLIVVEGQTEEVFVKKHLQQYLQSRGCYNMVQCHRIRATHGGLISFHQLESDLCKDLRENEVIVSTMIDLYALPEDFPGFQEARRIIDHCQRVEYLENCLRDHLHSKLDMDLSHFLPHIQLHEFESLVFSSEQAFEVFDERDLSISELRKIILNHPNPETINDGSETAPSKRLLRLVRGYNKVLDGNAMIQRIGFRTILEKCPHFSKWVMDIEKALE